MRLAVAVALCALLSACAAGTCGEPVYRGACEATGSPDGCVQCPPIGGGEMTIPLPEVPCWVLWALAAVGAFGLIAVLIAFVRAYTLAALLLAGAGAVVTLLVVLL